MRQSMVNANEQMWFKLNEHIQYYGINNNWVKLLFQNDSENIHTTYDNT